MELGPGDALVITDVQRDFCPGGALAVPHGDEVIPELNKWISEAVLRNIPIFATRDWHPPDHISFMHRGGIWPIHCVKGSRGAEFHPDLNLPEAAIIISKATGPDTDSYSAFGDTHLSDRLRAAGGKPVWIGGLALDYCVKETALDAQRLGLEAHVIIDGSRAVNVHEGDAAAAVAQMKAAGVVLETRAA